MDDQISVIDETDVEEHCRQISFRPLPNGKLYHVFLSYRDTDGDRPWVQELIEKFEKIYKLKCCNHIHDFKPGRKIVDNIKDAVISSVKTLIILSKEYHESYWCSYEAEYTHQISMELREKIVIPVIKEDCEIPDHLKPFTYIDARGPTDQWLPRLVSAIEEPVNYLVESKYSQLDFNTRYRNFDIVHFEKTKYRWCGCLGKLPFKQRRYIPDSLSNKVFNLSHTDYQDMLRVISTTKLIKYRHTCQPWIPSILFCIVPFLFFVLLLFSVAIVGLDNSSGNNKDIVQQKMEEEKNMQWSKPIKQNITVEKIKKELKEEHDSYLLLLADTVVAFLSTICFLVFCAVFGTCLKKRSIRSEVKVLNQRLIDHNLLAGLKFNSFTGTVKVVFIYFDHLPCLKDLTEYAKKTHQTNDNEVSKANDKDIENGHPSSTSGDDDDVPLLNIKMDNNHFNHQQEDDRSLRGKEPVLNPQDENIMSNQTDDTEFASMAKDRLCQKAPDFVWDLLNDKLEHTESGMHSTRVVCLCEYVKTWDEDLKKQSNEASSILQLLRCCSVKQTACSKLITSPELHNVNDDDIIVV